MKLNGLPQRQWQHMWLGSRIPLSRWWQNGAPGQKLMPRILWWGVVVPVELWQASQAMEHEWPTHPTKSMPCPMLCGEDKPLEEFAYIWTLSNDVKRLTYRCHHCQEVEGPSIVKIHFVKMPPPKKTAHKIRKNNFSAYFFLLVSVS